MAHSSERHDWKKEFILGATCGMLFGGTNTIVGHPLDTVKTKMHSQKGMLNDGVMTIISKTWKNEGIVGFYRGCFPPFIGSIMYRSI